jgi:hypothetical protein
MLEIFRFMSRRTFSWERLLLVISGAAFTAAVAIFINLGNYNRYMADDYCHAAALNKSGFVQAQVSNYLTWGGRFTYSALMSAAEGIGPKTASIGPPVCLTLWLLIGFWTLYQITRLNRCRQPFLIAGVGSSLIVYAMLNLADNLVQSVYWEAGYLLYTAPLVVLTIYIGLVSFAVRKNVQGLPGTAMMIVIALTTLFAGGFNEPYTFSQIAAHVLALAVCYFSPRGSARKRTLPFIVAGLTGTAIAFVIMVSAPGNRVRQSLFQVDRDLITVAGLTIRGTCGFILRKLVQAPLTTALLCLIPAYVASRHDESQPRGRDWRWLFILPLAGFLLVFVCYLPGVYGAGGLVARARFIPEFVFVCTAIGSAYFAGRLIAHQLHAKRGLRSIRLVTLLVVTAMAVLACSRTTWRTARLLPRAKANSSLWDQTDQNIRKMKAQGVLDQTIPAIDDLETSLGGPENELQIERDPSKWKNKCVATYYGIDAIRTR